jgi:hypothetical protein
MAATCSSETSVDFQRTTWRYIPEDETLTSISSLFPCTDYMSLKPRRVSVTQDHLQGVYSIKEKFYITCIYIYIKIDFNNYVLLLFPSTQFVVQIYHTFSFTTGFTTAYMY